MYRLLQALVIGALLVPLLHAQEPPPSQYAKLKALDSFEGYWSGDLDLPNVPKGARALASVRWSSNKSYLTFSFTMQAGEERTQMGTILVGLSAKTGKAHSWAFWPDSQASGAAVIKENSISIDSKGKMLDGKDTSAKVQYAIKDGSFTISVTNAKEGDEAQPDIKLTLQKRQRRRRGNN